MKKTVSSALLLAMLGCLVQSCQKGEYETIFDEFVDVYFNADRVALQNNGQELFLAARYNGHPIEWNGAEIRAVEGEGRFELYDKRNGNAVVDTTFNVVAAENHRFYLFQPTMDAPVTFYDPDAQANEEAAPEGHIKIKLANYAQEIIPFEKVDIGVFALTYDENWNEVKTEIGIIKQVAEAIEKATYLILPDGMPEGAADVSYVFEFYDSAAGEPLINHGGETYVSSGFSPSYLDPKPEKNVYTVYLAVNKAWGEAPPFIQKGEDYYEVLAHVLHAD